MPTTIIPKEMLTAYTRWEAESFDEEKKDALDETCDSQLFESSADAVGAETSPIENSEGNGEFGTFDESGELVNSEESPAVGEASAEPVEASEPTGVSEASEPEPALAPGEVSVTEEETPPEEAAVLPTAADIERMYAEAHQQGYSAGYDEGVAQGKERGKEISERMEALMSAFRQALAELDQRVADRLLSTSVEIAAQVVRQSLRVKPELLVPVAAEAVRALHPNREAPTLTVHPNDAGILREHLGKAPENKEWRIVENASITPGGCRVELGAAEVDATLETRWRRVIESIGIRREWLNERRASSVPNMPNVPNVQNPPNIPDIPNTPDDGG